MPAAAIEWQQQQQIGKLFGEEREAFRKLRKAFSEVRKAFN